MLISIDQLVSRIRASKDVVIQLPANPLLDQQAAGLALAKIIMILGKKVTVLGKPQSTFSLPAQYLLVDDIKGNNLNISWPYPSDSVDQVTTEINREKGIFTVIVQSKPEKSPVDYKQIKFGYSGISTDLIISIGTDISTSTNSELHSISKLPGKYIRIATSDSIPSVTISEDYVNKEAVAVSYIVLTIAHYLKINLTEDIATLILQGMEHRTEHFANPNLSASFFMAVSECLKSGGKRLPVKIISSSNTNTSAQSSANNTPEWLKPQGPTIDQAVIKSSNLPISGVTDTIRKAKS